MYCVMYDKMYFVWICTLSKTRSLCHIRNLMNKKNILRKFFLQGKVICHEVVFSLNVSLVQCCKCCKRGPVGFKGVTLTIDRFERERGRVGGGEEMGINKREVTELQGIGGQFSSIQRGSAEATGLLHASSHCAPSLHHSMLCHAHSLCVALKGKRLSAQTFCGPSASR